MTSIKDICLQDIKIVKPVRMNSSIVFSLEYRHSPFIIQTPYVYIKYRPVLFDSGYYRLDLDMSSELQEVIHHIEDHIISRLKRKYSHYITNFTLTSNMLRVRSTDHTSIDFFDSHKQSIAFNKVSVGDRVRVLLNIDKFVCNEHKSFLNYRIVQVQQFMVYASSLIDYTKYEQMYKMGVPMDAIKHKMKMDDFQDQSIQSFRPLPPPPPGPPPPPLKALCGSMENLFKDIKAGKFELKKTVHVPKLQHVDTSKRVPSLGEIQNALKNLRKIN